MAPEATVKVEKFVDDVNTRELLGVVEAAIEQLEKTLESGNIIVRSELSKFVWLTVRKIRTKINPHPVKKSAAVQVWADAKGMLKGIIHFDKFNPGMFKEDCIPQVLEKDVHEALKRYAVFVQTGDVETKRPPPKLLGETDEVLCVDKPINYTCEYGGKDAAPVISIYTSTSGMLNCDDKTVQIHEYLARKFNYETAVRTRDFWASGLTEVPCHCGICETCGNYQSGCCNRLDRETSGVMVVAKTSLGFPEIRKQFASENQHTMSQGGIEKYYVALAHGAMEEDPPKGEVNIAEVWHPLKMRAFSEGSIELYTDCRGNQYSPPPGADMRPCWAKTYYEPLAWYSTHDGKEEYTLVRVQIVTGRRHQIRFHCAEIGFPLVGDPKYGAPKEDLKWCGRMFLHSYQTRFREPFTDRWFQATSPLPQELGKVLATLKQKKAVDNSKLLPLLSRRQHDLLPVFQPYDPSATLLKHIDLDENGDVKVLNEGSTEVGKVERATKRRKIVVPLFNADQVPQTPPTPRRPVPPPNHQRAEEQRPPLQSAPPQAPAQKGTAPAAASTGWKRLESRKQQGVYYYFNSETGEHLVEPPPPWEKRTSRSNADVFYYWNTQTGQTSTQKPEV